MELWIYPKQSSNHLFSKTRKKVAKNDSQGRKQKRATKTLHFTQSFLVCKRSNIFLLCENYDVLGESGWIHELLQEETIFKVLHCLYCSSLGNTNLDQWINHNLFCTLWPFFNGNIGLWRAYSNLGRGCQGIHTVTRGYSVQRRRRKLNFLGFFLSSRGKVAIHI